MLFVTCDSVSKSTGIGTGCAINIAYNKQLPLCSPGSSSLQNGKRVCRSPEGLCTGDPDFRFDLSVRDDNPVRHHHYNWRTYVDVDIPNPILRPSLIGLRPDPRDHTLPLFIIHLQLRVFPPRPRHHPIPLRTHPHQTRGREPRRVP